MPYSASGTVPPPFFHTSHDAVPIIAYNTLHAGAKIQSGGVQDGFLRLRYLQTQRTRASSDEVVKGMAIALSSFGVPTGRTRFCHARLLC